MKARQPLDCQAIPLAGGKGKVVLTPPDVAAGFAFEKLRKEAGFQETAPAESLTLLEYVDRFKISRYVAAEELRKLVAAGKLKVGQKAVRTAAGKRILMKAYWPA
jgi:hypothetical protein